MDIDFDKVKWLLKEGVKETIKTLRESDPHKHIYAFALYDADGDSVAPSTNTEEFYTKVIEREAVTEADERLYYRWCTAEWEYEGVKYGPFEDAVQLVSNGMPDYEDDEDVWMEFKARSFGASIFALKELSEEGFFGEGESRITVFFSLSDNEFAPWLEVETARRCNPPKVFSDFEKEWRISNQEIYGDSPIAGGDLEKIFIKIFGQDWIA